MLPISTWKPTSVPSPWEINAGRAGETSLQQSPAWFIVGGKAAPLAANAGQRWVAQQRPCARLCGHQAQGALPGAGEPRPPCPRPPRSARPGGAELWPRAANTRGSVNAMTSLLVSAAQQEMLSASPLPARRKWGSLLKRSRYSAGPDLVSGPRCGSALPPTRSGPAGAGRRGQGPRGGCADFCNASLGRVCQGTSLC